MASTSVFGNNGQRIGYTETRSNGDVVVYDKEGRRRGEYSKSSNYTFNQNGQRVGPGNQAGMLFS